MLIKSFLFPLVLIFLFSCGSAKHERPIEKELPTERAPQLADNWDSFWKSFSTAVQQKDRGKVAGMTRLPLPINIGDETVSKETFTGQFNEYFDEKTIERFAHATDRDFEELPFNEEVSVHLRTPNGIQLKTIQVMYVFDKGTDSQTESSKLFVFGEIDGQYQLLTLLFAGSVNDRKPKK